MAVIEPIIIKVIKYKRFIKVHDRKYNTILGNIVLEINELNDTKKKYSRKIENLNDSIDDIFRSYTYKRISKLNRNDKLREIIENIQKNEKKIEDIDKLILTKFEKLKEITTERDRIKNEYIDIIRRLMISDK